MDDRTLDKIFAGSLHDLPAVLSKIVRIFTSSTFTDMSLERNTLMEEVYPKIKEYCKERHGLEFQVVDMRWGVRDEATDDHMTTQLCMTEIKNCQRLSVGPNFVVFLGQKYGYRPIPTFIDGKEFRDICEALLELQIMEVELLYLWYTEDHNAVPSIFILQPISSILFNFNNKSEPELQAKDQSIWWETLNKLQRLLRIAANHLHGKGLMTSKARHNYIMSVTEREVINGVLNVEDTKNHCLGYIRQIQKINMTDIRKVGNFMDLVNGDVDKEAHNLLSDLRDNRLVEKILSPNIVKFKVDWSAKEGGLNSVDHSEYLREFTSHFYRYIVKLVKRAMRREDQSSFGKIVTEILQHSHMCNSVSKIFLGRESELQTLESYILDPSQYPLVLFGAGGSGKTSLLAKAATLVGEWSQKSKGILVLRFLGTTPDSSSVIPTLTSICQQLSYNYTLPMDQMPDDLIPLSFYYKQLLLNATPDQPLFLFLDSVDQLTGPNQVSLKLGWLTYQLPANVKLVISCVSEPESDEYRFLKRAISHSGQFTEVATVTPELAIAIMERSLTDAKRTLTEAQWDIVKDAFTHCTLPIFVKLVLAEVIAWKSYSVGTWLTITVMESILKLFNRIETQHGKVLVAYALAYLTASKSGLSENELEDLISLDDIVLNDIYQYHLPPARRIPPLLWTRIRSDLPNYLSEGDADGVCVMNWYHRQFREASVARYLQDADQVIYIHSAIAEYFIGTWGGGKPKPFKYTDVQKNRFGLTSDEGQADRKVPLQPNAYYGVDARVSRYNYRKLGELPFHLTKAKRFEDLFNLVLFDYNWLHSKLSCCPLQSVLNDFEFAKEQITASGLLDRNSLKEVQLLTDTLKLAAAVLIQYPSMLAPQIAARLLPLREDCLNIKSLLNQCDDKGANHCALFPINHCLHTPGGPLMYSLEGHPFAVFDFVLTADFRYILSVSNKFLMWDLSTGEVSRDVDPMARGIMQSLVITEDDKLALTFTNYNEIYALDILTGEVAVMASTETNFEQPIIGITIGLENDSCVVWTCRQWAEFALFPGLKLVQVFDIESVLEKDEDGEMEINIVSIDYVNQHEYHLILQKGCEGLRLKSMVKSKHIKALPFVGAIVLNKTKNAAYAGLENWAVAVFRRRRNKWISRQTFPSKDNYVPDDELLSLVLTPDELILTAIHLRGFLVRHLDAETTSSKYLALPGGVRNISVSPLKSVSRLIFTKHGQYAVAAIRQNLYVWGLSDGNLLKIIDSHYGRILQMRSLIVDETNAIVTSSLDRTVKVWNVCNIFEQVHVIDRMELPVEAMSFSQEKHLVATVTRNCVGIWCLRTAKLLTTLADSPVGAIVTHAAITNDGNYLISLESGKVLIWDLERASVVFRDNLSNAKHLQLDNKGRKMIIVSVCLNQPEIEQQLVTTCKVCVGSVPDGETEYDLNYTCRRKGDWKAPQITRDNQYLVIPAFDLEEDSSQQENLAVYTLKKGILLHKISTEKTRFSRLLSCSYRGRESVMALIGSDTGYFVDINTKRTVGKISRWNGGCTRDGKLGLYSSPRGGLEILELSHGSTLKQLLSNASEGVVNISTGFTSTDEYVYYYHSIRRTIRLFRVEDGALIANYKLSAEARAIHSSPDGSSLIVGGADGSLQMLIIVDPKVKSTRKRLSQLPSRCDQKETLRSPLLTWKVAANLAKIAAKRTDTNGDLGEPNVTKACVLS